MRGTPSCMTTSESLPITRRIWPQARAEPMPSPSGRACEVTTKRRRARISCRTRSSMSFALSSSYQDIALAMPQCGEIGAPSGAGLAVLPATFLGAAQKLVDPALQLIGAVDLKIKLGRPPEVQPFRQFVPHIILGGRQALKGALG